MFGLILQFTNVEFVAILINKIIPCVHLTNISMYEFMHCMNSMNIWIHIKYEYNEREYNSELMHNIYKTLKGKKLHVRTNSSNFRSTIDSHKCLTFRFLVIHFIRQKWKGLHGVYTAIGITIVWLFLWLHVSRRNNCVGVSLFNCFRRIFPFFFPIFSGGSFWFASSGIKSSSAASNFSNICFLLIFSLCVGFAAFVFFLPHLFFFWAMGGNFGELNFYEVRY